MRLLDWYRQRRESARARHRAEYELELASLQRMFPSAPDCVLHGALSPCLPVKAAAWHTLAQDAREDLLAARIAEKVKRA